jgi:hypothetical protein
MSQCPDVGAAQLHLIEQARAFIRSRGARGLDVAVDPECYLNPWAQDVGNSRLHALASGWRALPLRLSARMKDAARLVRPPRFSVTTPVNGHEQQFATMVVSWTRAADFDADGVYFDRYFRLSSADAPDVLWFLVSVDGVVPPRIAGNVRICHPTTRTRPEESRSSGSRGLRRRSSFPSHARATAESLAAAMQSQFRVQRLRHLLMAYEAQPFQHAMNLAAKAHDPHIVTAGYHHSSLTALPTDLVYRNGAPDRLFVHGSEQADILCRHLGWPQERLQVVDSLRYRRNDPAPLARHILLPYSFDNAEPIVTAVEGHLRTSAPRSMPQWSVRNHPMMTQSAKHVGLENRVRSVIERYRDRMTADSSADRQTLIIGATAAVLEALERGLDVVHICTNPLFEAHTSAIWRRLSVEALAPAVYRYRLNELGGYIRLGAASQPARERLGTLLGESSATSATHAEPSVCSRFGDP